MPAVTVTQSGSITTVRNEFWEVKHDAKQGGCWTSLKFFNGSRKNVLAAPVSGRVRNLEANPQSDASSPFFFQEKFEGCAAVSVEQTARGVAVIAEGVLRLKDGGDLGVAYKHTYEYREHGLVACELEFDCPAGRDDIVEVVALEMELRAGMTHAYARKNPIDSPYSDLLGGGEWYELGKRRPFMSRYVPIHMVAFEKGVEGIEFSPASDLGTWNESLTGDAGMGLYEIRPSYEVAGGTTLSVSPYCVAYRRNAISLQGKKSFKYYLGLPFVRPRGKVSVTSFHMGVGTRWPSDEQLELAAKSGVGLVRFHCDYRKDGPFWRDGLYPPFDAEGMAKMRHIVDKCHELGMKIIPYISVKEFHPDVPGCKENQEQWRQQAGPAFRELHTWAGTGEFGQLMCLESGWLDFRKQSIEIILQDMPWDGLYFDWCTPHPCRNPNHCAGHTHTDQDAFYDFMFWVRKRVGPDGIILAHLSGLPHMVVENLSTATLIYEEQNYGAPHANPDQYPVQCEFVPIVPQHLCGAAPAGTPHARQTIVSGLLQGTPITTVLGSYDAGKKDRHAFSYETLAEMALLAGKGLEGFAHAPAGSRVVQTGSENVFAGLWHKKGKAILHVGNLSTKGARGKLKFDPALMGLKKLTGKLRVRQTGVAAKPKESVISAAALKKGLPYAMKAYQSAVIEIEPVK